MVNQSAQVAFSLVRRSGAIAQTFPLDKAVLAVGRGQDNDVVLDDVGVSRHHARLSWQANQWLLEDLGSRNGTFVNGQRIGSPTWLRPGDQIAFGPDVIFSLETARTPPIYRSGSATAPIARRASRRSWTWLVVPLVLMALVLVGAGLLYAFRLRQAQAEFEPPRVWIAQPAPGAVQPQGSAMLVLATAFGHAPIRQVELWLDGELSATQQSFDADGESPFYAYFSPSLPAGPHLLFVRATDVRGLIGQSLPMDFVGAPPAQPGQLISMVRAEAGQTLADIAADHNIQADTLIQLNPTLVRQPLTPGALVQVPAQPPLPPPKMPSPTGQPPSSSSGQAAPPLQVIPPAALPDGLLVVGSFFALQPPDAPSALQAEAKDCKVVLRWNDNAVNESSYEVWAASVGATPQLLATLKPANSGPASCELPAPGPGLFSFWVNAVNLVGSAPSNIASVTIGPQCPATLTPYLRLTLLDLSVGGGYDRIYFYTSFEGLPEVRLPTDPSAFIALTGGQGNLNLASGTDKELVIPIPADGVLNLSGECWGWAGTQLSKLGAFNGQFPQSAWNGTRQEVAGSAFQMGVAIQAVGAETGGEKVAYKYEDPNLPVPYALSEEGIRSIWGDTDPYERMLSWKWDGDNKKISGFKIYLNGAPYNLGWLQGVEWLIEPGKRSDTIRLPALCGKHIKWQVSAVAGEAESKLSAPFEYDQPECPLFAEVKFNWVEISFSDVGAPNLPIGGKHCDQIDTWYWIWANDRSKAYWGGTFFMPLTCQRYTFKDISGWPQAYNFPPYNVPGTDTIVVPLEGVKPTLRLGAQFGYDNFWGEPGYFGNHSPLPTLAMTREEWAKFQQTFEYWGSGAPGGGIKTGVSAQLNVTVRGFTK